jgi:hypothetical protein
MELYVQPVHNKDKGLALVVVVSQRRQLTEHWGLCVLDPYILDWKGSSLVSLIGDCSGARSIVVNVGRRSSFIGSPLNGLFELIQTWSIFLVLPFLGSFV